VTGHLEPVPELPEGLEDGWDADDDHPPRRPAWWRWVAIVVVVALVVATPVAYALSVLLR